MKNEIIPFFRIVQVYVLTEYKIEFPSSDNARKSPKHVLQFSHAIG